MTIEGIYRRLIDGCNAISTKDSAMGNCWLTIAPLTTLTD
jgi:hypothetical protein